MSKPNHFPGALVGVVGRWAGGSRSEFAERTGLAPATVSRLCTGSREITRETLAKLGRALPEEESRRLYLAAVLDFLPEEGRRALFPEGMKQKTAACDGEELRLDGETEALLEWLRREAIRDRETRNWLKKLAEWMGGE